MAIYEAPLREFQFLYRDVLRLDHYANLPGFADAPLDVIEQVLEEGAKFVEGALLPLNAVGDKEGCVRAPDGAVTTPTGFKDAYRAMVAGGWPGLAAAPDFGGQGLPGIVGCAFNEMACSANMAFAMYPGLTHGAYSAILAAGDEKQKALYLPKLASGEWSGTMNLTEPQCGTDLGLLRTKAVAQEDGSYRITGQKIWISGGEHDLTPNIVHLVLARIEGAPAGVKGISLFVVPKFMVGADGALGDRNAVSCGGLEEKMGIHGSATCVMQYDDATGYLIGAPNEGLKVMFVMMNEARLGVALQGLAMSEIAYQNAAEFAKTRLQGRALKGAKNPDGPADPIIVHPDVRRMLMDARAFNEGARAFLLWTALHHDLSTRVEDSAEREKAEDVMALMTPVLKSYLTGEGFRHISDAMQVHGGSGFTEHFPISQYLRDSRIAMIYEGANGVQAMDLVGRKLAAHGGRALRAFLAEIEAAGAATEDAELAPFIDNLNARRGQLMEGAAWLMQNGMSDFDNAGAASHDFLCLFAVTALSYMWRLMAEAAIEKKRTDSDPFYAAKLDVGRYYIARLAPEAGAHLEKLKSGAATMMALPAEAF